MATYGYPPVPRASPAVLWVSALQAIHQLPDGCMLGMWVLHSGARVTGLAIGKQITICRDQGQPDSIRGRPVATAVVLGIVYCDREQVIFRIRIRGDQNTSLLAAPVHHTKINFFKKLFYQMINFSQPSPPPLSRPQEPRAVGSPSDTYEV